MLSIVTSVRPEIISDKKKTKRVADFSCLGLAHRRSTHKAVLHRGKKRLEFFQHTYSLTCTKFHEECGWRVRWRAANPYESNHIDVSQPTKDLRFVPQSCDM
jgi:hypothetical protein